MLKSATLFSLLSSPSMPLREAALFNLLHLQCHLRCQEAAGHALMVQDLHSTLMLVCWKIIHVPITKCSYRIRISDKLVDIPPQPRPLKVSVNPARAMPDEWTVGGVTFFVISPGNTDASLMPLNLLSGTKLPRSSVVQPANASLTGTPLTPDDPKPKSML